MKNILLTLSILTVLVACDRDRLRMPSTDMEGTIRKGTELSIKKTRDIRQNQVIAFDHKDPLMGEQVLVLRVVAVPGDTIKIREGQVFVNRKLFTEPEQIKYSYRVNVSGNLSEEFLEGMEYVRINSREYVFQLTRAENQKLANHPAVIMVELLARTPGALQEGIFGADEKDPWNVDNFGPVKIPLPGEAGATEKLYFVLGDNRHSAIDSRYFGYVSEKDILGVVEF